jgi:hypothetical protein
LKAYTWAVRLWGDKRVYGIKSYVENVRNGTWQIEDAAKRLNDPYDRNAFNFLYGAGGGDPAKNVVADTANRKNSQVIALNAEATDRERQCNGNGSQNLNNLCPT